MLLSISYISSLPAGKRYFTRFLQDNQSSSFCSSNLEFLSLFVFFVFLCVLYVLLLSYVLFVLSIFEFHLQRFG